MSKPEVPNPVKLVISVFSKTQEMMAQAIEVLATRLGKPDFISEVFPFEFTSYYEKEMGKDLIRRFLSFHKMILPHGLPNIKLYTNQVEERFYDHKGDRRINIDPGYISLSHLILATGKGYAHRPYLRKGIYADLTLVYKDKSYCALDWTYPDYKSEAIIKLMNTLRRKYVFQLKGLKSN